VSYASETSPDTIDVYQHLLAICNELVQKNKVIKLEKLYNIARRELQVDSQAILQGIKKLEDDLIIKADSKLIRSDLLQNETRRELYTTIARNPGISFNQIRSNLGKGTKLLLWHLEVLLDFGCIAAYSFETNAKAFFTKHIDESEWGKDGLRMFQLFQNHTAKKILDMLADGDTCSVKQMEDRLDLSRQSIEYHLKRFQDQEIVDCIVEDVKKYFIIDMKRRLFLKCKDYFASQVNA